MKIRPPARRPARLVAAAVLMLGLLHGGTARADDEGGGALETRIYDVGVLVNGREDWKIDRGPFPVAPDRVNDEEYPLFGFEGHESIRPLGSAGDLAETLRGILGRDEVEFEGVSFAGLGIDRLKIRASAALHAKVEAAIEGLEREVMTIVTVDVVACEGSPPPGASFAEAAARGSARPLAAARAAGFVGHRIAAFEGGQRAYVQDHDVEVASKIKTADPIVGILPEGLAFTATVTRAEPDVRLSLDTWLARVQRFESRDAGGDLIEVPVSDGRAAHAEVTVKPGSWTWVSTAGDVSFAVRATVELFADPRARAFSLRVPKAAGGAPGGAIRERRFPVGDLTFRQEHRRAAPLWLWPSNYTPPEPPGLPEPAPAFPLDALPDILMSDDHDAWAREDASIAVKEGTLVVKNDEAHLDAIGRLLDGVRARELAGVAVAVRVVSAPLATLGAWWADGGGAPEAKALLALPGARVEDVGTLRVPNGTQRAYGGGAMRSYVGDWDVEIAEGVAIGNPIVKYIQDGLSCSVRADRAAGGGAYACEVRLDRAVERAARHVATRHGDVECPSLGLTRFRGMVVAKPGDTRVLSAGLEGESMRFVLLTLTED